MGDAPSPTIPGYRLGARLGAGGMATVFRATQMALGREVALKVVLPQYSQDEQFRARFLREARAAAMVNHPHVITCYDAGESGGQLFMALELVTGGDLLGLLGRKGGRLEEGQALQLIRDCLAGLEAIEACGLIHRDIKPANVFLTDKGVAKLADLGLARQNAGEDGDAQVTQPGLIMGTPAYMAPEQARGETDLDIRADLYGLGATWYHLLCGEPPFVAATPVATLARLLSDPTPDPRAKRPDLSAGSAQVLLRLLTKDRAQRHPSARHAREDLDCLLAGQEPRHTRPAPRPAAPLPQAAAATRPVAPAAPGTPARGTLPLTPAGGTAAPATPGRGTTAAIRSPQPFSSPGMALDEKQLAAVAKRVVVDKDGLTARIALAPGATFPRILLEQVLAFSGITTGIDERALQEAAAPREQPRRLVIARGSPASPGVAGEDVRGERIPPLQAAVVIRIANDGMSAVALTRPNCLVPKPELEAEVKRSGIRFGLEQSALRRLVDGPAEPTGRLVVARGRAPDPGRPAGFALKLSVENTSAQQLASAANLQRVSGGTVVATWEEGQPPQAGMDVLAREVRPPPLPVLTPEECAGEGTEIIRDRDGRLCLRARHSGLCQQSPDGMVRVAGVVEVDGDLGPDSPPIDTNDLVVVRGNVKAGARISSSSDVVILGDLEDAHIEAGGSIEVNGSIGPGQDLIAGGTIVANGSAVRRVMASHVRINGEVRGCEIIATGDICVGRVVGGALTAGGSINVDVAGDTEGSSTHLWAGHHLTYSQQAEIARLTAKRQEAQRTRLLEERKAIAADLEAVAKRSDRIAGARFVNENAARALREQAERLRQDHAQADQATEQARLVLAKQRETERELANLGSDHAATLTVGRVAHAGVVVKVANLAPEVLDAPRMRLKVGGK